MTADEFATIIGEDVERYAPLFAENMKNLGALDMDFCNWINLFIAWMEWKPEDCSEYYGKRN